MHFARSFLPQYVSFVALLALGTACGGSSGDDGGGTGGGSGDCSDSLAPAVNSEFCAANPATIDCTIVNPAAAHQVCGVALVAPPGELKRSENVDEYAGSGPPDIGCFVQSNWPAPPSTSESVTVEGFARIFSNGFNSNQLKITFYTVKRTGGEDDGQLGDVVGESVVTADDCTSIGEESEVDGQPRWECPYSYPNVPSEVELAIKTESSSATNKWSTLVQYNIYIPNSEVAGGTWSHDVRALDATDYSAIPQVAIGGPITAGNGVVAGEVHDCGDVRLENAVADIDKFKYTLSYYTSNEDSPLPDIQAKGTSILSLYSAFDVASGPVTVAAGGLVGGEFVALGQHRVWVYPDTVTSVSFKGLRPYQVAAQ
jgi:hypothetical protein